MILGIVIYYVDKCLKGNPSNALNLEDAPCVVGIISGPLSLLSVRAVKGKYNSAEMRPKVHLAYVAVAGRGMLNICQATGMTTTTFLRYTKVRFSWNSPSTWSQGLEEHCVDICHVDSFTLAVIPIIHGFCGTRRKVSGVRYY